MCKAALEDGGCLPDLHGDPLLSWFPVPTGSRDSLVSGELPVRGRWEDCIAECSETELRCDSGAQDDNKSDVLPREEMETMTTGCCGGDLAECLLSPAACQGAWRDLGHGSASGEGSPGVSMAGALRGAGVARLCLINFRPLPSRIISALNLF